MALPLPRAAALLPLLLVLILLVAMAEPALAWGNIKPPPTPAPVAAATAAATASAAGEMPSLLGWMAWTWQTAVFFLVILAMLMGMTAWELALPGGAPRQGLFGIETTRGDRLFISLLGSAFIMMGWLSLADPPLWVPLGIAAAWFGLVFWKV